MRIVSHCIRTHPAPALTRRLRMKGLRRRIFRSAGELQLKLPGNSERLKKLRCDWSSTKLTDLTGADPEGASEFGEDFISLRGN